MSTLLQTAPGLGDFVVIALLLLAMAIPVAAVFLLALWLTRSEWAGDRKDAVDKDLDASFDVTNSASGDESGDAAVEGGRDASESETKP